ncbi:hypothetical protein M431DRAFT_506596 [Trichoderma harzianum CBS 226.95]|uniref:Uncharacterized protein n=1 Tax=Trichoderma harzianum CBS 226.95 TaxID=983964 RepID=A0A2T4AID2_TRIHA|nr:hypothetical protein M431DRAFT_506596 [Trichoderma harzianum CBS 226.95]PTB56850.1 hypothetical protein M431DRAFT_506596 [Trichoderma harzianum CBS 226.95]
MKLAGRLLRICPSAHSVPERFALLMTPHLQLIPATTTTTAGPSAHPGPLSLPTQRAANHARRPRQLSDFAGWRERSDKALGWCVSCICQHAAYTTGTGAAKRARSTGSTEHRAWRRTILNWALFLIT